MPPYAGPSTAARSGEVAETLRLLAYLALALTLVVLDHRGGWLNQARKQAATLAAPLWAVAGWPGRLVERVTDDAGTLARLTEENRRLRSEALVNQARMARLQSVAADNQRLRGLLEAAERGNLDVVLAPILDIDLDPTRQRLVLDAGSRDRVRVGQSVIDAGGLLGQITGVTPMHASVLLVTDPSHAVPVAVARNGVRLVVYGEGRSDSLLLRSVPLSSDVREGDVLVTSGLGGRFPPGFPVGTIASLRPDDSRAFLVGDVRPAAQLDRGREVLVLLSIPPPPPDVASFDTQPMPPAAAGGIGWVSKLATSGGGGGIDSSTNTSRPRSNCAAGRTSPTKKARLSSGRSEAMVPTGKPGGKRPPRPEVTSTSPSRTSLDSGTLRSSRLSLRPSP